MTRPQITALIVDDEASARSYLTTLLTEIAPEVKLLGAAATANEALFMIRAQLPDVLFLDIRLDDQTGFDLIHQLGNIDLDIIFTTAYSDYLLQAIKVSAVDYLLKPVDAPELRAALDRREKKNRNQAHGFEGIAALVENLRHPTVKKIAVPDSKGITYVEVNSIVRFEGEGNYTKIFLASGDLLLSTRRMKEYEDVVEASGFFRVHKSHLVSVARIRRFVQGKNGWIIMEDGTEIEVSRRRKAELLDLLGR